MTITLHTLIDDPSQMPIDPEHFETDMVKAHDFKNGSVHIGYAYPTSEIAEGFSASDIGCWFIADGVSGDMVPKICFETKEQAYFAADKLVSKGVTICKWSQNRD